MTLSDDAIVIRGGLNEDLQNLRDDLEDNLHDEVGLVLSVFASDVLDGETREDAIERVARECIPGGIKNGKIRVTTAGRLRADGFEIEPDDSDGQGELHHHVHFPNVSLLAVEAFVGTLDEPVPNPARQDKTT